MFYDFPEHTKYVKKVTGVENIGAYICHSLGCTQFMYYLSTNIEFAENFNCFIGMAPYV